MIAAADIWTWLTKKLYPNGRAFAIPDGGELFLTHGAINETMQQTKSDAYSILLSMLPDNNTFSYQDAIDWYRRLGLYNGFTDSSHLALMKQAIAQKQSFPYAPLNMQSPAFIQAQLQAAGFPVYIYPNRFTLNNGITGATVNNGGLNAYQVGDTFSINGGSTLSIGNVAAITPSSASGLTIKVLTLVGATSYINTWSIISAGTGYAVGDLFTLPRVYGYEPPTIMKVTSIGGGGTVTGLSIVDNKQGYVVGTTYATDNSAFGKVLYINHITYGAGYSTGTGVATTPITYYGTGLTVNIVDVSNGTITLTPGEVLGTGTDASDLAAFDLGAQNLGGFWDGEIIANYLEPAKDALFGFTARLYSTFYISGGSTLATISTYADIPEVRQTEFRQLVLSLKRAETVGFAFVNYT